jgi:hypothetical protein
MILNPKSLEKQIDVSEKGEQEEKPYSLHNSEGLDNQSLIEVARSVTDNQAIDSHSSLPDYISSVIFSA